ncbi:MAG: ADP-ribosylglycohydrolase family protein [Pseudomonadota bacterium]
MLQTQPTSFVPRLAGVLLLTLCAVHVSAEGTFKIDRGIYAEKLHGFWLGQSIANWTGLVTELDRVEPPFYTDADWGGLDEPAIFGRYVAHSSRRAFYLLDPEHVWGADDDTDIEYIYWHLMHESADSLLGADQIRDGWLKHIYSNEDAPPSPTEFKRENFLWVSNETAYYLMKDSALLPPATSDPEHNPDHAMIDAQLTTESFGLMAPGRPDVALHLAELPIRVTASGEAAAIAGFYVVMHSLAATVDSSRDLGDQLRELAREASTVLPEDGYARDMFDFVDTAYSARTNDEDWASVRDALYREYQAGTRAGYRYQRPFDAGINFAASLVSLYFGNGDFRRTVQIACLAGWDSDNPAATWGGLLGFILGREGVEAAFGGQPFSEAYWIHRTRRAFPDRTPGEPGEDRFSLMAKRGVTVVDRVVERYLDGSIRDGGARWEIPGR